MNRRLPAAKKMERDYQIRRLRASGITLHELAKQFGLTVRGVYKILHDDYSAQIAHLKSDSEDFFAEIVSGYAQDIRAFTDILAKPDVNPFVAVAALKGRVTARTAVRNALQSFGLLREVPRQIQVAGPEGGPVPIILAGGTEEEYIAALRAMRASRGQKPGEPNGAGDPAPAADR